MNKRKLGVLASYAYSLTQIVVNLLYVPLLLTGIGKAEYGLYQMVGSIIAYLNVINSTLSAGATRYYSKYYVLGDQDGMANVLGILKRIYRKAYVVVCVGTIGLVVVLRVVYASSLSEWEITESGLMVVVLAINLIVTMSNTLSIAVINAHEDFAFLKLSMLGATVLQPLFVLLTIKFFPCALTVSVVQLFTNTLCRILQHWYAKRKLGMDTQLRSYDKELERGLLAFSGAVVLALVADQIFWKTNQLILGYMYGTTVVAVYSVGAQVVNAYIPLGLAISSVFLPKVSELWYRGRDLGAISDLFLRISRIALFPLLAVLIGFIVFGRTFVELWAGPGFDEAYWVAVIILVPFTVDIMQNIGLTILQVMNKYGFRARMYILAAIANVVGTVLLAPRLGCVGASISSAVAILVSSGVILNWYYARRIGLGMARYWKNIIREALPLAALGLVTALVWSAVPHGVSWVSLVAAVMVYAVSYVFVAYCLSADDYERTLVKGVLGKLSRLILR